MGLFRRRRPERPDGPPVSHGGPPDKDFAFLSQDQGRYLRALVTRAFADRGLEVVLADGSAATSGGGVYGLFNLAAACAAAGAEREWPALVDAHVELVVDLAERPSELDTVSLAEALPRTYLRVVAQDGVPEFCHSRPLTPDLTEVLALDSPESVAVLGQAHVERLGEAELREAGLMNLLSLPLEETQTLEGAGGARLYSVSGSSVYTASKLLVMADVLRRVLGEDADLRYGVLVCMPDWHGLVFHVIADATVFPAVQTLARTAAAGFGEWPNGVSPHLFWWRDGRLEQITSLDPESGAVRVEVRGELAAVLEAVAGGGAD